MHCYTGTVFGFVELETLRTSSHRVCALQFYWVCIFARAAICMRFELWSLSLWLYDAWLRYQPAGHVSIQKNLPIFDSTARSFTDVDYALSSFIYLYAARFRSEFLRLHHQYFVYFDLHLFHRRYTVLLTASVILFSAELTSSSCRAGQGYSSPHHMALNVLVTMLFKGCA
jgi:hypothetical protein